MRCILHAHAHAPSPSHTRTHTHTVLTNLLIECTKLIHVWWSDVMIVLWLPFHLDVFHIFCALDSAWYQSNKMHAVCIYYYYHLLIFLTPSVPSLGRNQIQGMYKTLVFIIFLHELYDCLWVLAFSTRAFQAFQFSASTRVYHHQKLQCIHL